MRSNSLVKIYLFLTILYLSNTPVPFKYYVILEGGEQSVTLTNGFGSCSKARLGFKRHFFTHKSLKALKIVSFYSKMSHRGGGVLHNFF